MIRRLVQIALVALLTLGAATQITAQTTALPGTGSSPATSGEPGAPTPADLREFSRLLGDERMTAWLRAQAEKAQSREDADDGPQKSFREALRMRLDAIRLRGATIADAFRELPSIPADLAEVWSEKVGGTGLLRTMIYVLVFLFIGGGIEWLFWRWMAAPLARIEFARTESLGHSMRRAMTRGGLSIAAVALFAVGCVGSFLSFDWPPTVYELVLNVLIAAITLRAVIALGRFVFAPRVDALRLVPLSRRDAVRAFNWTLMIAAVASVCKLMVDTFDGIGTMGLAAVAVETLAPVITAAFVILAIWVWTKPRSGSLLTPILLTVLVLVILILGVLEASHLNWTLIVIGLLLPALAIARRMVDYYFNRAILEGKKVPLAELSDELELPEDEAPEEAEAEASSVADDETQALPENETDPLENYRPVIQRLVRFVLVVTAVVLLTIIWQVPIWNVSSKTSIAGRLASAAVDITVAVLIADLLWSWARTIIDRRLGSYEAPEHGSAPGPEARMATLLPLLRKGLLITVVLMVVLIALSSLGVNIGPLIAGAGVLGIAIGFGAQALVRDIVSGIFFLLDDAFRVGEYIEMGDLRGTVESMSIRSLRLRHHRGAVHTIPFGELKALTNHSRDWAIIKMEFRVPFETDLKLVKKLVKQVGKELEANEDYGHHLIQPLKSQGVRRMEEFNMVVGVKFMSKPGEQWTIRRDAYQKIRDAFDKNGLVFAERNVRVEVVGGDADNPKVKEAAAGAGESAVQPPAGPGAPIPDEP